MTDNIEILNKLKDFSKDNDLSLNELISIINSEYHKESEHEIKEKVAENKDLVGKCFYTIHKVSMFSEMKQFYLVLSNRSSNEYRVECLTFYEHPTYWFCYNSHKIKVPGDHYLGNFKFDSFKTDSFLASNIRKYTEISREEFNSYAKKYLDELLNTNWIEDHYRWGGILPTDEKWKIHDIKEILKLDKKEDEYIDE